MPSKEELKEMQSLPLDLKIIFTKQRLREAIQKFTTQGVYVSFSGGKDSTVLLDIVRETYGNDIPAVFVNTGLEYPEIQKFVKTFDNVQILYPKKRFTEVLTDYGYPIISKEISQVIHGARNGIKKKQYNVLLRKMGCEVGDYGTTVNPNSSFLKRTNIYDHSKYKKLLDVPFKISDQCCAIMKKRPTYQYGKETQRIPITAQMAEESSLRRTQWLKNGCNSFESNKQISNPMAFWTEQDVLQYIKEKNLPIASVYGDVVQVGEDGNEYPMTLCGDCKYKTTGCSRTGCIFCGFGFHLEKGETRFQRLKQTHPKQYDYCINGGHWVRENGKDLWMPSKDGLGMGKIFDICNEIYGENFYRYK